MKESFRTRLSHAWDIFKNGDHLSNNYNVGYSYGIRPDMNRLRMGNERSIVASIYNRIAIDVSQVEILHCREDKEHRYLETMKSGLNTCLTTSANIDQTGKALIKDAVLSMFDEGCVAIVPVEANINPYLNGSYDILSLRVGKIIGWYPKHVRVEIYNENRGQKQEIVVPKATTAIIENPFYAVMNDSSSVAKRLIRKLNILDAIDEQSGSGKLDIIIQLPYVVRSKTRQAQAEERRKLIEQQLEGSKYGIAYIDGTERVTQLNRPVENNIMSQIEYLTSMLWSQLGMTENVFNGTAKEDELLNYRNSTTGVILNAITEELTRKFLTKTARTQGQVIRWFNDPFKLVPVAQLAEIADKFTRNEILSSNEIRDIIGRKPSNDPDADSLRNKNLNAKDQIVSGQEPANEVGKVSEEEGEGQNGIEQQKL